MSLANFRIHNIDDPWEDTLSTATHALTAALDGHADYLRLPSGLYLWVEDNPAEPVHVWIAEKRRIVKIADLEDDQPFSIGSLSYSAG